jgi:hypothetical protein
LDSKSEAFQSYRSIFSALRERFDVGIYNLNYDNVALTALSDAYVGFDENGRFDAAEVQARREWGFVYHLHGSVHHTLQGLFADSMGWQTDLSGSFDDCYAHRSQNDASDGKSMPKTTLTLAAISSINSYQSRSRPSTPLSFGMCMKLTPF